MKNRGNTYIIIVAAGSGSRFGSAIPKQFLPLEGQPVILHSIATFRRALPGCTVLTVLAPDRLPDWEDYCRANSCEPTPAVAGGDTRWQSVKNAISAIGPIGEHDIIMVHDGARPLASAGLICRVADALTKAVGAIPAVPVTDSLRRLTTVPESALRLSEPVDRATMVAVQTPQGFRAEPLVQAYQLPWQSDFTDDASVMAAAGHTNDITLVDGDPANIKITNPIDLDIASILLRRDD